MAQSKKKKPPLKSTPQGFEAAATAEPADLPVRGSGLTIRELVILAAILFTGFLLRASYLHEIKTQPDFDMPTADAQFKDYWARGLLSGNWATPPGVPDPQIPTTPYIRPPAYPFFLAFVYLVTGESYTAVRVLQMGIGLINCLLLFYLGRTLYGRRVALTAAAFMSIYWIFIFFEGELAEPSLIILLLLSITWMVRVWPAQPTFRNFFLPGILFGILVLTRTETLLFTPFFLAWGWWVMRARHASRQILRGLGVFALGIVLMIAPVTARNYIKAHEFVLVCTIGGLNLYAGNNEEATGSFPDLDYRKLFGISQTLSHHNFPQILQALKRKTGNDNLKYEDIEKFFTRQALSFMVSHPLQVLKVDIRKAFLFWGPKEVSSNKIEYLEKQNSPTLQILPGFPIAAGLFALGLAMIFHQVRGGSLSLRYAARKPKASASAISANLFQDRTSLTFQMTVFMLLFILVSFFTHILFFVVGRFRVPIIPFMILFGAYGLCQLYALARAKETKPLTVWAAIGAALLVLFHIPFAHYDYDAVRRQFLWGSAYGQHGQVDKAIAELQKGVDIGGNQPWLYSELGFAYGQKQDWENAAKWYDKAIAADATKADTLNKYGYTLIQLGRFEDALVPLNAAIKEDFTSPAPYINKALALTKLGRLIEAEAVYHELLKVEPGNIVAEVQLAQLYSSQGKHEQAITQFKEAIAAKPLEPSIYNDFGYELASIGRTEEAIGQYQKALDLSPEFPAAHMNIGNALAQLKKYNEAVAHYAQAVHYDYTNVGAHYGWGYVLAQQNKLPEAIQHFQAALQGNPNYAEAHNFLGYLLFKQGNPEEAISHYKKAIELNPQFVLPHNNLGDLWAAQGKYSDALEQYETALKIDPANPYALKSRGEMQEKLGLAGKIQTLGGQKVLQF